MKITYNLDMASYKSKAKKEKKPEGRPTDYNPKYCQMLLDYFNVKPYSKNSLGKLEASDFKSLAGFAISIGVHRETLLNWSKQYPEFFDAYKRAKDFQENFLVVNGMKGLINPAFSIFTAKNVLNWRDKRDVEIPENSLEKLTDEELDTLIREKMAKIN